MAAALPRTIVPPIAFLRAIPATAEPAGYEPGSKNCVWLNCSRIDCKGFEHVKVPSTAMTCCHHRLGLLRFKGKTFANECFGMFGFEWVYWVDDETSGFHGRDGIVKEGCSASGEESTHNISSRQSMRLYALLDAVNH